MSLKAFHLAFIVVCVLFAGGFGAWCIHHYTRTSEFASLVIGVASVLGGAVAVYYARWFRRKLEGFSYL